MDTLDAGETASISTQWYKSDGSPEEPSDITLTLHPPTGVDVVKHKADMHQGDTTDVWLLSYVVTLDGLWRYDVEGTVDGAFVTLPSGLFLVGDTATGLCEPWTVWEEVEACDPTDFSSLTVPQRESFLDTASSILFDLSERRYRGVCVKTRSLCVACRSCWPTICTCEPYDSIDLGPNVHGVWDVVVDGETLVQGVDYELVGKRYLARLNWLQWPRATDFSDAAAFHATWAQGRRAPIGGRKSAALFTAEMAKSCLGVKCQLPQRVQSVTREGVTYTVIDSMKMVTEGRTGIYLVDLWLTADKRGRRSTSTGLFAPGGQGHSTRTMR